MPYSQRVEKVNSQKIMHKKFSPAFFKRRWGQVGKSPCRPPQRTKFSQKERRRGVKRPGGTFYGGGTLAGSPPDAAHCAA